MTMQLVQHIELPSAAANITFSSIPQDGTDLMLVLSTRTSRTGNIDYPLYLAFNGQAVGTNSSRRTLYGGGSSTASFAGNDAEWALTVSSSATSNTFASSQIYIPNYSLTTVNKSISGDTVTENNATSSAQAIIAGLWANNAAITQIAITTPSGNWVTGSSATLYKVTKGSIPGITVS